MNDLLKLAVATLVAGLMTTQPSAAGDRTVVELFQSQGCSSCPPANANVNALTARGDLLVLSFAVTYWDRLGWRDTFARDAYTNRQYDYAHGLGEANVYTPQVVLNGRQHLTGARRGELDGALARAGRVPEFPLAFDGGAIVVRAAQPPRVPADIWLVRYDPRTIQVAVQAGENGGRTLPHANIVRELVRIGEWNGQAQTLRLPAASGPVLKTAILIQQRGGGAILAALAL